MIAGFIAFGVNSSGKKSNNVSVKAKKIELFASRSHLAKEKRLHETGDGCYSSVQMKTCQRVLKLRTVFHGVMSFMSFRAKLRVK